MENELNYEHGYTSRESLNTETDKVLKILMEHMKKEQESTTETSLIEYSCNLEDKLKTENRHDHLKNTKLIILDNLVLAHVTDNEAQAKLYEGEVRARLSKYKGNVRNILNGWTKQVRIDLNQRRNNII